MLETSCIKTVKTPVFFSGLYLVSYHSNYGQRYFYKYLQSSENLSFHFAASEQFKHI